MAKKDIGLFFIANFKFIARLIILILDPYFIENSMAIAIPTITITIVTAL